MTRIAHGDRVRHDQYGTGTVTGHIDAQWILVLFDGEMFAVGVHVNDLARAAGVGGSEEPTDA